VADPGDPCDDTLFCNGADHCSGGECALHDDDPCDALETCVEGRGCLTECETAEAKESYVGCEYWGAFLQNDTPNNYAVVVANPNDTEVTVTAYGNGNVELAQFTVAAYGVNSQTFDTTRHLTGAGIFDHAFKFVASRPVTMTQMNPFGNVLTYTNDASLLLPKGALGHQYYAMSWPDWYYYEGSGCEGEPVTTYNYPGFVSVVAVEPGTTTVTVTYHGDSAPGDGEFAAQEAGDTVQYTLTQYQILNLNSAAGSGTVTAYGADLTGSLIEADKRVAVFGGHECTDVPADKFACDHLEHQVFPLRSWGKEYVAVRTKSCGTESDYLRILASVNGTSVSWSGG
ncbi:MAG TPA: IgGFc-binding protein, partial [bacterium]|nr:IgGFc-binding protein [bacterium]